MASIPLVPIRSTSDGQGRRKENWTTLSTYLTPRRISLFNPEIPTYFEPM